MTNLTLPVNQLASLWRENKSECEELLTQSPYNNKAILRELVRNCLIELSNQQNLIDSYCNKIDSTNDKLGYVVDLLNFLRDNPS